MPAKRVGAVISAKCSICGDELLVGWDRGELPVLDPQRSPTGDLVPGPDGLPLLTKGAVKKAAKDAKGIMRGPLTCSDGNVTVRWDAGDGQALVEWLTAEPVVANVNLH